MKVTGPGGRPNVTQVHDKSPAKSAESATHTAKPTGERVAVSSLSKLLSQVRAPDAPDTEKVQRLSESIKAGTFKVDHEQVAETMLHEEL